MVYGGSLRLGSLVYGSKHGSEALFWWIEHVRDLRGSGGGTQGSYLCEVSYLSV